MVWIVNPCHVITLLQIVLLSLPPGKASQHLLRCLGNSTNGPIVALLFPLVHTRFFYFERHTYFLQHWLIVLIPWLLVWLDDESYSLEELGDWSYAVFSMGLLFLYHWIPLQLLSIAWGFNLNVIVCPSSSDPFYGQNYRIACFLHQTIMCLFTGKLVRLCGRPFVRKAKQSWFKCFLPTKNTDWLPARKKNPLPWDRIMVQIWSTEPLQLNRFFVPWLSTPFHPCLSYPKPTP